MIASVVCVLIKALVKSRRLVKDSPKATKYDEIHLCVGRVVSADENNPSISSEVCDLYPNSFLRC